MTGSRRSNGNDDGATKSVDKPEPGDNDGGRLRPHTRVERRGRAASRVNRGCVRVESAARCANKDVGDDARSSASDRHARANSGAASSL